MTAAGSSSAAARSAALAERALAEHRRWRGKIQIMPKCPVRGFEDFALWYTPGVAAAARAIRDTPSEIYDLTAKGDTIAIVSDGSRVLGLGDIGPAGALPVMEGKALLFKYLGGVDAVPLCVDIHDEAGLAAFVHAISPTYAGVNLEDISAPKCFRLLETLQQNATIPVWHDDQQGTAAATLAGLRNALSVVGKQLQTIRIGLIGVGAANFALYRLLIAAGVDPRQIIACDSRGVLNRDRADIAAESDRLREKWRVCLATNPERRWGGIADTLAGADVCIAFSRPGPNVIPADAIRAMARDAVVFACANPTPEIWPDEARKAGAAIVATGRSDFPNQVNNALVFPGLFRGVLDVRAPRITEAMALAASDALAARATTLGLTSECLLPRIDDIESAAELAGAVATAAMAEGCAAAPCNPADIVERSRRRIVTARAQAAAAITATA